MTARPMADGERAQKVEEARALVANFGKSIAYIMYDESDLEWAHALLSTSTALREVREALMQLVPFLDDLDESPHSVGVYPDVACSRRCRDAVATARAAIEKATKP